MDEEALDGGDGCDFVFLVLLISIVIIILIGSIICIVLISYHHVVHVRKVVRKVSLLKVAPHLNMSTLLYYTV